jgi:hypothetical protein
LFLIPSCGPLCRHAFRAIGPVRAEALPVGLVETIPLAGDGLAMRTKLPPVTARGLREC